MDKKYSSPEDVSFQIEQYIYREYKLDPEFPITAFLRDNFVFPPEPANITWLHFHNCVEIMYCYEERILNIENRIYWINPGSVCVIPPNQMHNSRSTVFKEQPEISGCEYLYLDPKALLGDFCTETYSFQTILEQINEKQINVFSEQENPVIVRLIIHLLDAMRKPNSSTHYMVKGLSLSFWVELMRILDYPTDVYMAKRRELTEVYPAMVYIRDHYAQEIQPEILADLCHMSLSQFRQNFKKCIGLSPKRYIDNLRLSKSCQLLLETELGILPIALRCGFNSLSSYNSHFTARYGTTPTNWKNARRSIKKTTCSHSVYLAKDNENAAKSL